MIVSAISDIGTRRENNEDALYASNDKDIPLYIVADGMGGHNAGDIASTMAIDIIKEKFMSNKESLNSSKKIKKFIKNVLIETNGIIYEKSIDELNCEGMGTTVVLGYYYDNRVYIGHVGDSRAYIIRGNNIIQITEDHTLVNELIKKGSITQSQALNHPQRNVITQALGTSIDIEYDIYTVEFTAGEILLLCSDGLYNMLEEEIILGILKRSRTLDDGVKALVNIANEKGGIDNITIITFKLDNEVLEWLEEH